MNSNIFCVVYILPVVMVRVSNAAGLEVSIVSDNFNCYVKANEYICTFEKPESHKSYLYQSYETDVPRTKATFRQDYTYLEAVDSFYKLHKKSDSWDYAKRVCEQEGATLFYPENSYEAKAVISFWNPTPKDYLWVGISDLKTEGVFVTVDGRLISEVHNKWKPSQPDNYKNKEHCVHINKNTEYNDIRCDENWCSFICKKTLLQNIQLDYSSVIGVPLNTSAMITDLNFELESFDNNTSVYLVTNKLQRSKKIILTAENVAKDYVKEQTFSETTEVQFSCDEYRAGSEYLFVALINTAKKKIQTFNETQRIRRKFKMADSGSILCCLHYVYKRLNDGNELSIKRFVSQKTLLTHLSAMSPNLAGIPDQATSAESNDYSWLLYVLSAFLGLSLLLALYMISKKCRYRNPQPVEETAELDAHALQNQVLYASLDFVNNGNQPQNQHEESHYAEIIGVLYTR